MLLRCKMHAQVTSCLLTNIHQPPGCECFLFRRLSSCLVTFDWLLVKVMSTALSCTKAQPSTVSQYGCTTVSIHNRPLLCISGRRSAKLISVVVSAFTASFVQSWSAFFPHQPLKSLPIFDARTVCYPTDAILRDYLSWRQADTHINNQV